MLPAPSAAHGHDGGQGWEAPWYQGPQGTAWEVKLVQASQNQPGVGTE